jgi:amino acid adenylation domain-containing protein
MRGSVEAKMPTSGEGVETVVGMFEGEVERGRERVAVVEGGRREKYGEVNERANQLARYLRERGVRPEVRVGLSVKRGVEMVVGVLGILKAGGVYVPLDAGYPEERLKWMVEDAGIEVLVSEAGSGERMGVGKGKVEVNLEGERERIGREKKENPGWRVEAENAAYVIYTSGSTGRPKGVVIEHGGLRNQMEWMREEWGEEGERMMQRASMSFDVSLEEIFYPLVTGGRVVVAKGQGEGDLDYLVGLMEEEGITVVDVTPGLLGALLEHEGMGKCGSLRRVYCGGEALGGGVKERFFETVRAELYNMYGPTETTIQSLYWRCKAGEAERGVPIGRPIGHTQAYILDEEMESQPAGAVGELYLGGRGLARGYWKEAEHTAERFVPNPFSREGGARLYRTGDMVRSGGDGAIEFVGRNDGQVKIRGYRIELGEVEAALKQHPAIADAVVMVTGESERRALIGYLTTKGNHNRFSSAEMRKYLTGNLPRHAIPGMLVVLEKMPLLPNGKVDRKSLSVPASEQASSKVPVPPNNPTEREIIRIWTEVLGQSGIGVEDDFLDLGGHSLFAAQAISRINKAFKVDLPITALFEASTPKALGYVVADWRRSNLTEGVSRIPPADRTKPIPLSYSQEQVWFMEQLYPSNRAYNYVAAIHLAGRLNVDALQEGIRALVKKHEIFRTAFAVSDGEPYQIILPSIHVDLEVVDLTCWPQEIRLGKAESLIRQASQQPFDIALPPLFYWTLLKLDEKEHLLFDVEHHLVHDGWSVSVVLRDLIAFYKAFASGIAHTVADSALQFADFVTWQRERMRGDLLETQLDYWKAKLCGIPEVFTIPVDHARGSAYTFNGAAEFIELSDSLVQGLKAFSKRERVTLFMTMLAVFKVLLWRYTQQTDILVGSTTANRRLRESESMVGMVVNPVVLRTDLSGNPTVRELLHRVRETTLGAYAHQDIPFLKLVEALRPGRNLNRNLLYQLSFDFHDTPMPALVFGEASGRLIELHNGASKFDCGITCIPRGTQRFVSTEEPAAPGLTIECEYNTDLYDRGTIKSFLGAYQALLEDIVGGSDRPISRLCAFSMRDVQEGASEVNAPAVEGAVTNHPTSGEGVETVVGMFEGEVERGRERVAVVEGGRREKYGEVNERANQLARYLRERGVRPEVRVGLSVKRGVEMVVGVLGILKAGGVYVPLDAGYPEERLKWMVEDAGIEVLVSEAGSGERMGVGKGKVEVNLEGERERIGREKKENPGWRVEAENAAYVIYTSGSTGRPKGVVIEHGGLRNQMEWMREEWGEEGERMMQRASMSFDVSLEEIFYPLVTGGRVVVAKGQGEGDLDYLVGLMEEEGITVVDVTPGLLGALLEHEGMGKCGSLRRVYCGGEALGGGVKERFFETVRAELYNMYGPTETTIQSLYWRCKAGEAERGVPIGRPIGHTQAYILDEEMESQPAGAVGELYLGGRGLARGYWKEAEHTAERFVPNPFSREGGARLYRTGDMVRSGGDGAIEFVGRNDGQVKIRGYRIELGEVEAALKQHPAIADAVAMVREHEGQKRLVGYLVARKGEGLETRELRKDLQVRLPEYMLPSTYVMVNSLPLTPSGKVERRKLPEPQWSQACEGEYVAPRTLIEELVAGIWAELLKLERVGVRDNFFELGGHSLLATQVVARIRQMLHMELPLRAMFEAPTVAESVALLADLRRVEVKRRACPLQPRPRTGELPLSFAQQRLWFIDQIEPGSAAYNMSLAVRLTGILDVNALQKSLAAIVQRHEVLRTRIENREGCGVQVIEPEWSGRLEVTELPSRDPEGKEIALEQLAEQEMSRPFDLEHGPMLRVRLLQISPAEFILLTVMHHIVSDGWSAAIFTRELSAYYEAFHFGRSSPLTDLPLQYADFAVWQRLWCAGELLEQHLAYWRKQLQDAPLLELPTDHPRAPIPTHRGRTLRFGLSQELTTRVKELSRQHGATLFMVLLAGLQILLSRYTDEMDIAVGTAIANRSLTETEQIIGFFLNTVVLRTRLTGNPTVRELLVRVREVCLGAYSHQDLPFEKLVEELQPERDLSRSPLFQTMLVLQNTPEEVVLFPEMRAEKMVLKNQLASYDLMVTAVEKEKRLEFAFEYSTDLFNETTIERMQHHFENLLRAMVEAPESRIGLLPLMNEQERDAVLRGWNQTAADYDKQLCIHSAFEVQAERTPNSPAILFEGSELTYAELSRRSNQWANWLLEKGVTPGMLIGVALERSAEMVVVLLGILKTGAAYLPLDPSYPGQRLALMLEDAKPWGVITHSSVANRIPPTDAILALLDHESESIAQCSARDPKMAMSGDARAYVVYTSGSTGAPKGVEGTHMGAMNRFTWMWKAYPFRSGEVCCQKTTLGFVDSVWEIFGPLLQGVPNLIIPRETVLDLEKLLQLLAENHVSRIVLVPSLLKALLDIESNLEERVPRLRMWSCSGEVLPPELAQRFLRAFPDARLLNIYGTSEVAADATFHEVQKHDMYSIPIGRPIANTQVYVLDSQLQPVPVGVCGQIYVGGDGLSTGYWNQAGMTSERFIPNPIAPEISTRLYSTGDAGRYLEDGTLQYLGRRDNQVKVRGHRIELDEVEATIRHLAGGRDAAVIPLEDKGNRVQQIWAYVVGTGLNLDQLREAIEMTLPAYMVPAGFTLLPSLPLGPNGKVDKRRLSTPQEFAQNREHVPPRTPTEKALAKVWGDLLRLSQIGVWDDFFRLGGHSLLAAQVISRVRSNLGVELPLSDVFLSPVLCHLAKRIDQCVENRPSNCTAEMIRSRTADREPTLSFNQQAHLLLLWWSLARSAQLPPFRITIGLQFDNGCDAGVLEDALNEILTRHSALRTSFSGVSQSAVDHSVPVLEGLLRQCLDPEDAFRRFISDAPDLFKPQIHDAVRVRIATHDLRALAAGKQSSALTRICEQEFERTFDYDSAPLARAVLFQLGQAKFLLAMSVSHLIWDRWSTNVFLRELAILYKCRLNKVESPLSPLTIQFADFALWQKERMEEPRNLARLLRYWKEQWSDFEFLDVKELAAVQRKSARASRFLSSLAAYKLGGELSARIRVFAQERGVTLYMFFLGTFSALLSACTRRKNIGVQGVFANRMQVETESLIGWFANTHLLGISVVPELTMEQLLHRVRDTVINASAHQEIPLELLRREIVFRDGQDDNAWYGSWITFDLVEEDTKAGPDTLALLNELSIRPVDVPGVKTEEKGLHLMVRAGADQIVINPEYSRDELLASDVESLLENFQLVIEHAITFPNAPVAAIADMLSVAAGYTRAG